MNKLEKNASSVSTHEPQLPGARRSNSARRKTSIMDFDFSKFQISIEHRNSFPLVDDDSSIIPLPADKVKSKTDKKVVFNLENVPSLVKATSSTTIVEFSKRFATAEILVDAVKYSLEHKDDVCQDFDSFLRLEDFTEAESLVTQPLSTPTDNENVSTVAKFEVQSIVLEGNLKINGNSECFAHAVRTRKSLSSKNALPGDSPSTSVPGDIWPWPWLNPELRVKTLYKSPVYNRVTFLHQKSLPTIPLPILGNTLKSYLQSVKPCMSTTTYSTLVKVVNEFAKGEGKIYHEYLMQASELESTSWIREFLPNYTRCYSRQEAPMLNTAIVAPFMYDFWPEKSGTQLTRAAILVELAVEFWELIKEERLLPLSVTKDGQPACMHEFRKLFSSVKLPGIPRDEIYHCYNANTDGVNVPKHIVVFYKGEIFSIDVRGIGYSRLGFEGIWLRLWNIVQSVDEKTSKKASGVGILTSLNRNTWSKHRLRLMELSCDNSTCLNAIERAIFVLSLDHGCTVTTDQLPRQAIFGDGCNRWYDKSLNFQVSVNGLVTVNVNASILEGTTVAFLLDYIHLRIMEDANKWDDDVLMSLSASSMDITRTVSKMESQIKSELSLMSDMDSLGKKLDSVSEVLYTDIYGESMVLEFELDEELEAVIEEAKADFLEMSLSLRTAVCQFEQYESNIFSMKAINRDAFAHLIMQLTFFKMYYRPASVCSKISLRRFHYGRYELLHTTTGEAVSWCKLMLDSKSSFEDQSYNFYKAEKKHVSLLRNAFSGKGNENHLAALRVIAEDIYSRTPKLFQDERFYIAGGCGRFNIYAECLGLESTSCAVLWPTSLAGYGVGYVIANSKIVFNVTSWTDDNATSAELFVSSLNSTLTDLHPFLKRL